MRLSPLHLAVLDISVDDYYALYEISGWLRNLLTNYSEVDLRRIAHETVAQLIAEGLVALYTRSGIIGGEVPLQPEEINPALCDENNWKIPKTTDSNEILILATKLGEQAYHSAHKSASLDDKTKSKSQ